MKTKSHFFTSAMALCAAAVLSFTFADSASAFRLPDPSPGPTVGPEVTVIPATTVKPAIEPLPAITPPVDSGTFNGVVMD